MLTLYTITLVVCCVTVALAVSLQRRHSGPSSWLTPSTLGVLSASSATLSTLAYALSGPDSSHLVPLVIGDVTMPLAVGLIGAAMRHAAGRTRTYAVPALIVCLGVGAVTLLVSGEAGTAVKLGVLALFSILAAIACLLGPLPALGSRLVAGALLLYGLYCVARLVGPQIWGAESTAVQVALTQGPSTIVAAASIAVVAWGALLVIRDVGGGDATAIVTHAALIDWVGALLSQSSSVTAIAVSVPDLTLNRIAFGRAWAQTVTTAVDRAMLAAMPVGSVVGRAGPGARVALQFGSSVEFGELQTRIQESYERMLGNAAPTEAPDLDIKPLTITEAADIRRYARRVRATARRAMSYSGG